mgnify:CR=1 FL=1
MPRYTTTYNINDEFERLDARLDELAEEVVSIEQEMDSDDPDDETLAEYEDKLTTLQQKERELAGVSWARDPDGDQDPITEVTVGALTAGEYATAKDRTAALEDEQSDRWGVESDMDHSDRLHVAAAGLVDAAGADVDGYDDAVTWLASCLPQFVAWLADRVDEASTPDISGKNSNERLAAARSRAGSDSGSADSS